MKRILIVVIAVCMALQCACAEGIDLTNLSFSELIELQQKLTAEIISRPEWKEVTVPAGTWIIGKDIPAGEYSIKVLSRTTRVNVYKSETASSWDKHIIIHDDDPIGKIILSDGMKIVIDEPALFAPAISLGF